jgi:hypothetical protein
MCASQSDACLHVQMNGRQVDGVQLVVSLSYRQTYVENTIDDNADSAAAWKSIGVLLWFLHVAMVTVCCVRFTHMVLCV